MGCDNASGRGTRGRAVSIHAPTWGATVLPMIYNCLMMFQSTHPHGVRRSVSFRSPLSKTSFNPRTHMGCDCFSSFGSHQIQVSIHAPTWGATSLSRYSFYDIGGFNPRTHMGCDQGGARKVEGAVVSIHAPTWGATTEFFNILILILFQSTHPHGVRLRLRQIPCAQHSFNPRTHMGCDGRRPSDAVRQLLFQSTHPHGVRRCWCFLVLWGRGFNPRTHMGCDKYITISTAFLNGFQSTHPHGVRHFCFA